MHLIVNEGREAGASLPHSHAQLYALPFVPAAIAQFWGGARAQMFAENFNEGTMLYYILSAVLILFFTYFYTSIIFNPMDLAENLKKQGGFIPGVKPGAKTAEYIDHVVSRITLPGAIFRDIGDEIDARQVVRADRLAFGEGMAQRNGAERARLDEGLVDDPGDVDFIRGEARKVRNLDF